MSHDWDPAFEAALREAAPNLPASLDPAADLFSLGFDSMQLVGLFVTLELMYHVQFPVEALTAATTSNELWERLRDLIAARNASP